MKKIILAYVPVLHRGYLDLFRKYGGPENGLCVFGKELIGEFDSLRKDIRAIDPNEAVIAIRALDILGSVKTADAASLNVFSQTRQELIMPEEDICHELAERYLGNCPISFESVFLRWDSKKPLEQKGVVPDEVIPLNDLNRIFFSVASSEAEKSSDWWRQVGAVLAREGEMLLSAFNHHVPSHRMPYFLGDPRATSHKGLDIEISTAFHAEASLIATAAKNGIVLEGASLYTTTFPCPPCAKLIAYSGIKELFFREGYAMVDGQEILRSQGVKVVLVE